MKKLKTTLLASAVISLFGVGINQYAIAQQSTVDMLSKQIKVNYKVIDNHAANSGVDCSALGGDWGACNKATITLQNNGKKITDKDWAIYFHSIRMILDVKNDQFKITHITGDLHRIEPSDKFVGIAANSKIEIPIIGEYWQVSQSDVIPRWYVTSSNAEPKVIANTNTENLSNFVAPIGEQWKRTPDDHNILMTSVTRYERNADIQQLDTTFLRGQIMPTPTQLMVGNTDVILDHNGVNLSLKGLNHDSLSVLNDQFNALNIPVTSKGFTVKSVIAPKQFKKGVSGAYKLTILKNEANIIAYDEAGIFYAVQSILSLIPANQKAVIATLTAEDAPRFDYRGIMADTGRNFKSKDVILRLLDQMAKYKMNKFHFHLSDDEGWRIEIPGLPELTEVGSQRCHDLTEQHCLLPQLGSGPTSDNMGSGYFSRDDYIEIVKYAKARFIEVIPEIDMPAHARAAIVSMEARYNRLMAEGKEKEANEYRLLDPTDTSNTTSVQFYDRKSYLNPCLDSSKHFVDKVIGEIVKMHTEAGQPISTWHFGGDEAKNIRLGAGYQDIHANDKVAWKGTIDQSIEDHPFSKSQVCQTFIAQGKVKDFEHLPSYFALEVSKIIKDHNINRMQAWQDGLKHVKHAKDFAVDEVAVNFWDTLYWGGFDSASEWVNKGYQLIVSNPDYVYLDFPYEVNPSEPGYYWGTRFNDERKIFSFAPNNLPQNAETSTDRDGNAFSAKGTMNWNGGYGLSAQLWSEIIRTDEKMEYMAYPRLLAVAERAWHQADWETAYKKDREFKSGETHFVNQKQLLSDWNRFANLVGQREMAKLDIAGIDYRLPLPGAKFSNNKLVANIVFPGLPIEFSMDNGKTWKQYKAPVTVDSTKDVLIRSRSLDGKRISRVEKVK
ncbi:beta-N-acetylhexosaminidase [Orbaceae bacterium ac157xtp]